jgi:hypothetical protein
MTGSFGVSDELTTHPAYRSEQLGSPRTELQMPAHFLPHKNVARRGRGASGLVSSVVCQDQDLSELRSVVASNLSTGVLPKKGSRLCPVDDATEASSSLRCVVARSSSRVRTCRLSRGGSRMGSIQKQKRALQGSLSRPERTHQFSDLPPPRRCSSLPCRSGRRFGARRICGPSAGPHPVRRLGGDVVADHDVLETDHKTDLDGSTGTSSTATSCPTSAAGRWGRSTMRPLSSSLPTAAKRGSARRRCESA